MQSFSSAWLYYKCIFETSQAFSIGQTLINPRRRPVIPAWDGLPLRSLLQLSGQVALVAALALRQLALRELAGSLGSAGALHHFAPCWRRSSMSRIRFTWLASSSCRVLQMAIHSAVSRSLA